MSQNEKFQLVEERAKLLKEQHDEHMKYALSLEGYDWSMMKERLKMISLKICTRQIAALLVRNLESEIAQISEDDSRKANNEDFMDGVKTDIYIEEVLNIMKDMLSQQ